MARPVLGILTLYLNDQKLLEERSIYQRMTAAGKRMGMDVMVFTPSDVDYEANRIQAMFYNTSSKSWSRRWTSFPHLIFDRCRIQNTYRFEQLKKFRSRYGHLGFLNRPLRNKWTIYKTLDSQGKFQGKQPETTLYSSHRDLTDMLKKHSLVFLKPINGTGGRGILRIERLAGGMFSIQGRDQSRKIIRPQKVAANSLQTRLSTWNLGGGKYIVQQGIQLKLPSGRVHDYRMLVQKNGRGEWEPTGCAGRIGAAGSITSNLHGGGRAAKMEELLGSWIEDGLKPSAVRREAEKFSVEVAAYLERQYGRLCELALDLAIDRRGGIWLLEVNPKPAREVFKQSGDTRTYERAIVKPLEYAMYLYSRRGQRKSGGRTTGNRTTGGKLSGDRTTGNRSTGNQQIGGLIEEELLHNGLGLEDIPSDPAPRPVAAAKPATAAPAASGGGTAAQRRPSKKTAAKNSLKKGTRVSVPGGYIRTRTGLPSRPLAVDKPVIRSVMLIPLADEADGWKETENVEASLDPAPPAPGIASSEMDSSDE